MWIDFVLIACCIALSIAWWQQRARWKLALLIAVATVAVIGILDHRWQAASGFMVVGIGALAGLYRRVRTSTQPHKPWASVSLLTLATLFVAMSVYWFPVRQLPAPTGQHPVGVRDFVLTDYDRMGVFSASQQTPRRLLVRVWYPASDVADLSARPYFTEQEAVTTATGLGSAFGLGFVLQYIKHATTNSYVGAPLANIQQPLPTVFYSHGYTSFAGQNTALMEHLASHGYIIYSVHHSDDGSAAVFPDGDVVPLDPELLAEAQQLASEPPDNDQATIFGSSSHDERYAALLRLRDKPLEQQPRLSRESARVWVEDRQFVHNQLQHHDVPNHVQDLVAASNLAHTGQMGMSFGGSTSGQVCMVDTRCAAAINLDGGDFHPDPFNRQMPVPFMMLYSDYPQMIRQFRSADQTGPIYGFNDFSYERFDSTGLSKDIYRFKVRDVAHLGYSDITWFMRNPIKTPLFGAISGEVMLPLQNDFVLGFLNKYLRTQSSDFPAAQLDRYKDWVVNDPAHHIREWWLNQHPQDRSERVVMHTTLGDIEIAIYPERAPISAANFLAYVDQGHYQNATLYRAAFKDRGSSISVIQGGLLAATMSGDGTEYANPIRPLAPIQHETTHRTGIPNQRGTIAYARLNPGTAGSEFFFNLEDNPVLDTDNGGPDRDGYGYATFGRVIRGLNVLDRMKQLPAEGATDIPQLQGQILDQPVKVLSIQRVSDQQNLGSAPNSHSS